ncbi:hypothetical protein BC830DRAFT_1170375 [Chytriomyces sp. MP71]|nr:hypothetical protein BC830DRAFT_1170375 [Chytriomyces sp. MP71]
MARETACNSDSASSVESGPRTETSTERAAFEEEVLAIARARAGLVPVRPPVSVPCRAGVPASATAAPRRVACGDRWHRGAAKTTADDSRAAPSFPSDQIARTFARVRRFLGLSLDAVVAQSAAFHPPSPDESPHILFNLHHQNNITTDNACLPSPSRPDDALDSDNQQPSLPAHPSITSAYLRTCTPSIRNALYHLPQPQHRTTSSAAKLPQSRKRWTDGETSILESAMQTFGTRWARIEKRHGLLGDRNLAGRSQGDLKDKARNELKRRRKKGEFEGVFGIMDAVIRQ